MYKFVALTDASVADGFRLGGVEVVEISSPEDTRAALTRLLGDDEVGIVALDERYESAIDERLRRRIESVYRPVIVMLPLREELDVEEYMNDRLRSMIRRAVGFDVTLRKEAGS